MKLQKFSDVFPNTAKVPDTKEAVTELSEKVSETFNKPPQIIEYKESTIVSADVEAYKAELIQKIEGMKKQQDECGCLPYEGCGCSVDDFNEALDNVLSIIKEK